MKKLFSILFCLMPFTCFAQYSDSNSLVREALVLYELDENGYYQKKTNTLVDYVKDVVNAYAYDKKNHYLYVQTAHSNCIITLTDEYAKIVKKDKRIPQLKENEITAKIDEVNELLEKDMIEFNKNRTIYLADSVAKAKADSLEKVKQDSIALVNYVHNTDWHFVPFNGSIKFWCDLCEENYTKTNYIDCFALTNDSIYFTTTENVNDTFRYFQHHVAVIPEKMKNDSKYKYHLKAFINKIKESHPMTKLEMLDFNLSQLDNVRDEIKKKKEEREYEIRKEYPYGFVSNWSWNDKYSNVTLYLRYFNTNKKTIKYIDVHFKITNAVGDVRKTGVFKGTGPVESFESAAWDWDSSHYYVAGDATNMELTQITLTFMDGTKKILPKNQIKFKEDD